MTGMAFDPAELDDEGNLKTGDGEGDGDDKDKAPSFSDFHVPDDHEDESLRGLSGAELISTLNASKELTKRAIEQANSASNAANAAANAANVAAAAGVKTVEPAAPTVLTKEDLLLADPDVVNKKIADIFAEKARPVLIEQYNKMSHQAIALARQDKEKMPHWDRYEAEIIKEAAPLSLNVTANMSTWTHLYATVIGRHQNELIEEEVVRRTKKKKEEDDDPDLDPSATVVNRESLVGKRVTVGSTGERGKGGGGGGKKSPRKLNDEQRATAARLGVSEDDYAAYLPDEE
jgi:uncharacterized membrane protein